MRLESPARDQVLPFPSKGCETSPAWIWKDGKTATRPAGHQRERDLRCSPSPPRSTQFLLKLASLEKGHRLSTCATLLLQQGVRLGARLLPWTKMLEKTTSLKQFNTGQKRHILICTAMHLGYKFTQHNWKKKSKLCFYTYSMVSASFLATYLSLHLWMLLYTHTNKQLRHECSFRLPSSSNKVQTCIASYATQP